MICVESTRSKFEQKIFNQYFMSNIYKQEEPHVGFALQVRSMKTKDEFLARKDDGDYVEDSINAAWWGWTKALEMSYETTL